MGYFGDLYNKSLGDLSEFVGGIQNQSKLDQATESLPIEKISNDMEISSLRDFSSSFDISLPPETAHIVHYDNKEHLVESGELDLFSQKRLRGLGVSDYEDSKIKGRQLFQGLLPNIPFLPGSFATQRIQAARKGEPSPFRVKETELSALFRALGFKFETQSIEKLEALN